MELDELRSHWDLLGRDDPLWAVLTISGKEGGNWDPAEFFRTGQGEIDGVMNYLATLPVSIGRGRALDFGCGVGRLTQALCRHFTRCDGVDIAPSMIDRARRLNSFGERCQYHLNVSSDLALFADNTFDFAYTNIVLQHMKPEYSRKYVGELIRVIGPGGIAVFQLPDSTVEPARNEALRAAPLPAGAYAASIAVSEPRLSAPAGTLLKLTVRVRNMGNTLWPARDRNCHIHIGNHWRSSAGKLLRRDDCRADLPADLAPGGELEAPISATVPDIPGEYLLELDMVHESVCWFEEQGSPVTRVRVQAGPRLAGNESAGASWKPRMEMHGIRRPLVLDIIRKAGAHLVDIQEDHSAGAEWLSYRYWVTKTAP